MNNPELEVKISRLPKWAQDHIRTLQRQRDDSIAELRAWKDSQSESLVYVTKGLDSPVYLQTDRVTFKLPNGAITVSVDGDDLDINGNYGRGMLVIRPWASNAMKLKIVSE